MKENNNPIVSVLIPAYNVSQYVKRCLLSIQNQTFKNFEVVIVNDGSTDNTESVISNFIKCDSRFKMITQNNSGVSVARNRALEESRGEYITFVDPDDYIAKDYLSFLYYLLEKKHFQSKMALCTIKDVFPETQESIDHGDGTYATLTGKDCLKLMCYNDRVDTSCAAKLAKRELYFNDKFTGFPANHLFEDMATTYSLFEQCDTIECGFVSKYFYEIRSETITTSSFNNKKLDLLMMTDQMAKSVVEKYPDLKAATQRRQIYARFSTLNQTLDVKTNSIKSIQKPIVKYINLHKRGVLKDPLTPKRDKMACIILSFGLPFYKLMWNGYCHFILKKEIH